ncbi:MAG: thiopurine S-methyltransferase [gamma proteobacterium symbiont of Taylorina sp.]|nr:thiopurine S-methyltransferase [gamma proteobacterium symbiont of Taylorina sp.]
MQHSYWLQRWQEKRIGFHLDAANPYLSSYLPLLGHSEDSHVFVPMCGKSHDLYYLHQQGYRVTGNELSDLAVKDFYTEQQLKASKSVLFDENSKTEQVELMLWTSPEVDIICGDFFALNKEQLHDITAVYDRGSLVALPYKMRKKYVKKLLKIVPKKVPILLVTLDYDEKEKKGPPFSVTEEEVFQLYSRYFDIRCLEIADIKPEKRSSRSQNMSYFNERVFFLKRL